MTGRVSELSCAKSCAVTPGCISFVWLDGTSCTLRGISATNRMSTIVQSPYRGSDLSCYSCPSAGVILTSTTTPMPSTSTTSSVVSTLSTSTTSSTTTPTIISSMSSTTFSTNTRGATTSSTTGLCYGGVAPTSTKTASNGDVYGVCSGDDFYGGELPSPNSSSTANDIGQCIEACSKTDGCIAAAFVARTGTCWQKNVRNDASINNGVEAIYKISSGTKPTTTTAKSTPTGACFGGATPKSTGTATNGGKYGICPGNDFYGGDLQGQPVYAANMQACYDKCSKKSGYVAVAFEHNECYLKRTRNQASVVNFVDVAYKLEDKVNLNLSVSSQVHVLLTSHRLSNVSASQTVISVLPARYTIKTARRQAH